MSSSIIRTSYFDNRLVGCLFSSAGYVHAMLCFHFNSKASTQCKYKFIGYKMLRTLAGDFRHEKELGSIHLRVKTIDSSQKFSLRAKTLTRNFDSKFRLEIPSRNSESDLSSRNFQSEVPTRNFDLEVSTRKF